LSKSDGLIMAVMSRSRIFQAGRVGSVFLFLRVDAGISV
jgi:hypothetical protein